ncbi:MAG: hydrolase [Ignavibacteriae bacterium]|nr:hydrolase [Ignavibacteriota bacterium]
MSRNKIILQRENTALLIIDIQEKILKAMLNHKEFLQNVMKLIMGINILQVPIYFTEQNPKGLGNTVKEIKDELTGEAIQKMSFSCIGADNLFEQLKKKKISQVIVSGIETHVCVQQTVLDLLANGFQVNVLADAVASRKQLDKEIALKRMEKHGAEITTHEAVLFELLNICGTQEFKDISKLIK